MFEAGGSLLAGVLILGVLLSVPIKLWLLSGPLVEKRLIPALASGIGTSLIFYVIYLLMGNPTLGAASTICGVGFGLAMLADGLITTVMRGEPIETRALIHAFLLSAGSYLAVILLAFLALILFFLVEGAFATVPA